MNTNDNRGQVIPHVQQTYNSPSHCDGLRQRFHEFWTQLPAYKCLAIRNWDQKDSQQGPSTYSPARSIGYRMFYRTNQARGTSRASPNCQQVSNGAPATSCRSQLMLQCSQHTHSADQPLCPSATHCSRLFRLCFFDVFWSLLKVRRSIKGT